MSITKSYNKHTGTYYAYETTYEWSDEKKKKVQVKKCIGKFDPVTGEVIPNGKVGRPSIEKTKSIPQKQVASCKDHQEMLPDAIAAFSDRLARIEKAVHGISDELHELIQEMNSFSETRK